MTNESPWLQAVDLCRYYRRGSSEVRALDRVTLGLQQGEFLGVVGSSGSGKSTLLNVMAGLDTPTSGRVEVESSSLYSMNRRQLSNYRAHKVGMIFQSFNLIGHYTALQNVEMSLLFNNTPHSERRRRTVAILNQLGLADRMTHRPSDLSGGEQQRVAIARAIVKEPKILFADEPTGNLDHDNAQQIIELLAELNRKGLTIMMVTHNLDMARRYAQRIIRMDYGHLEESDPTTVDQRMDS